VLRSGFTPRRVNHGGDGWHGARVACVGSAVPGTNRHVTRGYQRRAANSPAGAKKKRVSGGCTGGELFLRSEHKRGKRIGWGVWWVFVVCGGVLGVVGCGGIFSWGGWVVVGVGVWWWWCVVIPLRYLGARLYGGRGGRGGVFALLTFRGKRSMPGLLEWRPSYQS